MSPRIEVTRPVQVVSIGRAEIAARNAPRRVGCIDRPPTEAQRFTKVRGMSYGLFRVSRSTSTKVRSLAYGSNGAGKSTLLKILSRIVEPTSGEARMRGRVTSLLEVGTGFHPELTGRENMQLNGAMLGMSRKEIARRFDEIVEFSGVERFLDTPVKFYSSGMYVRLAFAVAAHLDPISSSSTRCLQWRRRVPAEILGKMQDVAGEGRTVLFVSHNADSVRISVQPRRPPLVRARRRDRHRRRSPCVVSRRARRSTDRD